MANTLLTINMVTYEALRVLKNQLGIVSRVNRQYDKAFAIPGAKIGTVLNIRKPPRYVGRTGDALQPEATTETSVPLVLDTLFGVDVEFSDVERALSLDNYSERVLKPQLAVVANKLDYDLLQTYKQVYNSVGSPGTVPTSFSTYLDAGVKLDDESAPMDDERYLALSPRMQGSIVNTALAYFNPQSDISKQYRKGSIGMFGGFEWFMDQNSPTHTFGTFAGTPLVNGASQTGASLITDGWTSTSLKKGDVFTIDNVYAVNPQSRQRTESLRQFVVTNDISDSGGAITIPISPSIIPSGQFQNVDSVPANDAALTLISTTGRVFRNGLAFHRDFATLACADLPLPKGVHEAARVQDEDLGLSIRMVTQYDVRTNKTYTRLDILYGIAVLYPELACRIAS